MQPVAVDIPAQQVRMDYDPDRVEVERLTAILTEEEYPVAGVAPADGPAETRGQAAPIAG